MSNKLTREVKYLSESDRPKKVEPLEFYEWLRLAGWVITSRDGDIVRWRDDQLRQAVSKYATYLQEFSAEEVGVVFTGYLNPILGKANPLRSVSEFTDVTYLGKDSSYGDVFSVKDCKCILIYYGHLHSGKF